MFYTKIKSVCLYEEVLDQIIDLLKSKKLNSGDKLPTERELSEKFGVSRTSLREAFRVLESRGLVITRPGGGRYIGEIKMDDIVNTGNMVLNIKKSSILEILEARDIFEQKVVEIATQRATTQDLKLIKESLDKLSKARNSRERTESNTSFHLAIAKASHNFVFINIMRLNLSLLNEIRGKNWMVPGRFKNTKEEHQLIYQAIQERNSKKASEAMVSHLKKVRKSIIDLE